MNVSRTASGLLLGLFLVGCGDDGGDEAQSALPDHDDDAVRSCRVFVDVAAEAVLQYCEGADPEDKPSIVRQLENELPEKSCDGADDVRDPQAFQQCLAVLRALTTCPGGNVPESCQQQIVFLE